MSGFKNMCIIGGDMRQVYMADIFSNSNTRVFSFNLADTISNSNIYTVSSLNEAIASSSVIVLPIPITKNQQDIFSNIQSNDMSLKKLYSLINQKHFLFGGCFPDNLIQICREKNILYYDFITDNATSILNAISTAEGSIMKAITNSVFNLHGNNSLVIGYGRCGKVLADKLKALGSKCYVTTRSYDSSCYAFSNALEFFDIKELKVRIKDFRFIFNTVPSYVLTPDILDFVSKEAILIDIASYPGGIDFNYAKSINLNAELYTGIPGKVSPKSSAEILSNRIINIMNDSIDCI